MAPHELGIFGSLVIASAGVSAHLGETGAEAVDPEPSASAVSSPIRLSTAKASFHKTGGF